MKLKSLFLDLIKEQDDGLNAITGMDDQVLEFPNANFAVSIFRDQKKLLFSPQSHQSLPSKVRTFVNMVKQNFNVQSVAEKGEGTFEITFDPREDFDSIIDWIKQEIQRDESL